MLGTKCAPCCRNVFELVKLQDFMEGTTKNGMTTVGKILVRWIIMILIIGIYIVFRNAVGWDESLNWSRFADLSALGTLGLFILVIYTREKRG